MSLEDFEIVTTTAGAVSIRNKCVNEIMHNPIGPWREANALYVDQSGLRARLREKPGEEFVLFDVGLGAASNAVAAIHATLSCGTTANRSLLRIVSFENNLELLEFTLLHARVFDHLVGFEDALTQILSKHHWTSSCGSIIWDLRAGDFLQLIESEPFVADLIFFDPYSPSVNQDMWTLDSFTKLRTRCWPANSKRSTQLFTYSVSTPVRTAMLLGGFYVGYGLPTGLKEETTQAATDLEVLKSPLSLPWFGRWQRSHKQLPYDFEKYNQADLMESIRTHQQFTKGL